MSEKIVRIIDRAALIMDAFSASSASLSLPELSAHVGLPKPTTFRIATVLVHIGWLDKDSQGAYMLGNAALHYALSLLGGIPIRKILRPIMETLRDEINETVVLSVRSGDFRYNVDSAESRHTIGQTQQIGVPIPLYAGAASRVLLAAMPYDALHSYLARTELRAFSSATTIDEATLLADLNAICERGIATSAGEYTAGAHAIAALFVHGGDVAALHFSVPGARYSPALAERYVEALRTAQDVAALP